jgi:hypothetical protein
MRLSDDAKCVYTVMFGFGRAGSSTLTFHMVESKPAPRTQAALEELVRVNFLSVAPFNKYGGVTYTLIVEPGVAPNTRASQALLKRNSWTITEPISA